MPKKRTSLADVAEDLLPQLKAPPVATRESAKPRQQVAEKIAPVTAGRRSQNTIGEAAQDAELIRTSVYIPLAAYKKLNELALSESQGARKRVNDYFVEGIDAVFAKRSLPSIAELVGKDEE